MNLEAPPLVLQDADHFFSNMFDDIIENSPWYHDYYVSNFQRIHQFFTQSLPIGLDNFYEFQQKHNDMKCFKSSNIQNSTRVR